MLVDRRHFLMGSAAIGGLGLGGCATGLSGGASSEAASLRAVYDSIFERMLQASPELASELGLDTGARAALKYRLGDASPSGKLSIYQPMVEALPQLASFDAPRLPPDEAVQLQTVRWIAERVREAAAFPFGTIGGYNYPVPYVLSQLTGSYQEVPEFLASKHKIERREDAEAYLARLEQFARNVVLESEQARAEAARGITPPAFISDKALAQTRTLAKQRGEASDLVQSLVRRTRERGIEGEWGRRATAIVDGPLARALETQIATLNALKERPGPVGASRLPGGERYYPLLLRFHTSTSLSPEEAHRIGVTQVAELSAEADPLLRRKGLTQGSVGARLTELGKQERYLYPNTDAGRAQLLDDVRRQMAAVRTRMPEVFATIPRSPMEVKRVPPAIELGAPRGYAEWPSLDGSRPGAYYINLVDTRIWPQWALPTLTYHESIPGHLWQGSIALENEAIPLLHRNLGIPAYGEGWGLYAEQLADKIGMYRDYPIGRIGMLQSFLYRAARIVVDTGMHSMGWSRDRAIRYFAENVGLNPIAAESEIDRYIVWPGQATSYKIGHNEFVRLREQAKAELGARFDLKSFHDAVLLGGNMPLEILGIVVANWVASRRNA
ncbi:MAG: DUF885 family protein [Pseudomonadota bacterium]|nr:DUF885 family protein [Pseudomonadota bacterium]